MASNATDAERRRLEAVAFARPARDPAAAAEQRDARERLGALDAAPTPASVSTPTRGETEAPPRGLPEPPEPTPAPPRRRRAAVALALGALLLGALGGWAIAHTPNTTLAVNAASATPTPVPDPLDAVFATIVANWTRVEPTPAQAAIAAQAPVFVNPLPDSDGFQVALALTGSEEVCVLVTYPDTTVAGSCVTGDEFVVAGVSIDSTGMRSTPAPASSTVEGQRLQPAQAALTRVNVGPTGSITETVTPLAGG
ncbi:hypothetical protein HQQ80_04395 [Microbacteriaceae bacterium VKM Ac-2855]|nr:hypothetical protein [Microbacteriaceae bacterium VKM Ac-2855]